MSYIFANACLQGLKSGEEVRMLVDTGGNRVGGADFAWENESDLLPGRLETVRSPDVGRPNLW
jgi:hypothetical protein